MTGPGRSSLCTTEGGATRNPSGVLLSHPKGALHKNDYRKYREYRKPPQQSVRSFFANDLKRLELHCSNPGVCRKLSETAGYSLQKYSPDASIASGIARSAKIV
jgi:hypothetical protein